MIAQSVAPKQPTGVMTQFALWLACGIVGMLLASPRATAGQNCETRPLQPNEIRSALQLAHQVAVTLDEARVDAALIARAGQDLSRHGLNYSHAGVVIRDAQRGGYTVVSLLNQCGTAESSLYDDGLGTFFLDNMHRYDAMLIIPSPPAQAKLLQAVTRGDCALVHTPAYNVVAYPFSVQYQNCNGWLVECLSVAEAGLRSRDSAQRWLRQKGYRPTTLHLTTLERLGGRMTAANITFDDHPSVRRFAGRIDVASTESVFDFYLLRIDPGARRVIVSEREARS
jgi:hypothetical protein